ncbi:MAG: hypothetical protein GXP55_20400, partial [Deltaproteobacteria bacterium]|nr:hypothetical protein [Deltaproteobacteria bacterium]
MGAGAYPGGLPPGAGALPYLPGIPNGSCIGFGCNVGGLMRCFGDQADRCLSFANDLSLSDGLGLRSVDLSTQGLGLDAPFGSFRALSRDLDGDGLGELVVTSPGASVGQPGTCPIAADCVPFRLSAAGRVLIVGSASGQVLEELDGEAAGEHFGAALEVAGDILAIGAPGANAGAGSLRLYELGPRGVRERRRLDGDPTAGLGAAIAVYSASWPPIFVASSPGLGELVAFDPLDGVRARSDRVNGALTRVVVARDAQQVAFVVASDSEANNGAGALFFFDAAGRATQRVDGDPGEALGSSLVADGAALGAGRVAVGAPGRNADSGAVDMYDASGQVAESFVYWGTRVGAVLATPG